MFEQGAEAQEQDGSAGQEGDEMIRPGEWTRNLGHGIGRRVSWMGQSRAGGNDPGEDCRDRLAQLDLHGAQARQRRRNVKHRSDSIGAARDSVGRSSLPVNPRAEAGSPMALEAVNGREIGLPRPFTLNTLPECA